MPEILSDIVDVYVFRRLNARVQFLLLQRRPDVAMPQTWQGFHAQIQAGETTLEAAQRAVREMAGLNVSAVFSADYVNQFYDDYRDVLVLAPVIAVNVSPQAPVSLGEEFRDCAWLDRDEATIRLPFSGQRWAVRHIDELMSIGEREADLYRLQMQAARAVEPIPTQPATPEPEESVAVAETFDEVAKPSDPTSNDFPILSSGSLFRLRNDENAGNGNADEQSQELVDEATDEGGEATTDNDEDRSPEDDAPVTPTSTRPASDHDE